MTQSGQSADFREITIRSDSVHGIVGAFNRVSPLIPREYLIPLITIKLSLLTRFGEEGLFELCNNCTVGYILDKYADLAAQKPIITGEESGVRYRLYDATDDGA